jgi:two-component system LytT family response regulator
MKNKVLYCLTVDDEPLALQVLEKYIENLNDLQLVAKCETVAGAFDVLCSQKVDIIFLDLNLNEQEGTSLLDLVKRELKNRYYLIITSAAPKQVSKLSFGDQFVLVDYLSKPFSFQQFSNSIKKVVDIRNNS